jgi:hypothetical protein
MGRAKRITITILKGIGKTPWYIGKGLWFLLVQLYHGMRWTARTIHEHDQRVAQEEQIEAGWRRKQQTEDAEAYRKAWIAAKAAADVRAQEERRKQNERNSQRYVQNLGNKMWDGVPKVENNDYLNYDPYGPKRKRRS